MSRSEGSSSFLCFGLSAVEKLRNVIKAAAARPCHRFTVRSYGQHNVSVPALSFAVKCSHCDDEDENDAADHRTSYDARYIRERKRQGLEEIAGSEYF